MASKTCTYVASVIHAILGLGLFATATWLYVEVKSLADMRNLNHYLLDYNVYWPQVIPWLFILTGFLVICVSVCGVLGASKSNKGLMFTHIVFVSISIFAAVGAAIVALVFVDMKTSTDFIKDTIWDVFFQSKSDPLISTAFGSVERRLQCCGANSPRDYVNWKREFPTSCCDVFYHGFLEPYSIDCDFTNKRANERHGCTEVATQYASIAIKVMSAVSLLVAVVGGIVLMSSISVLRSLRQKPRPRHIVTAQLESESKKVLL